MTHVPLVVSSQAVEGVLETIVNGRGGAVGGSGGADGGKGGGRGSGGMRGGGGVAGGAGAHPMVTMPTAASPAQPVPRVYWKLKLGVDVLTLVVLQALPWLPERLHKGVPAASTRESSPMFDPYM